MGNLPKQAARSVLLGAVLALGACNDQPVPVGPADPNPATDAVGVIMAGQRIPRPHEEKFVELASRISGFGGFFYDENGNLVAHLTDLRQSAAARAALEPILRSRRHSAHGRAGAQPEIILRQGQYGFSELSMWRDQMADPVLDIPGVTFTDLDEGLNQLTVGVLSDDARAQVEARLVGLNIPLAAVKFEKTGPIAPMAETLSDRKRPLEGGRVIYTAGRGYCSLGFPVYWSGRKAFITASHCTGSEWGPDSNILYQPNTSFRVGVEAYDPGGWSCSWFYASKCRRSDAAVIAVDDTVSINVGYIAQTWSAAHGPGGVGSTVINTYQPQLRITGEGTPVKGEFLDKMGWYTGWTYGQVTKTCADTRTGDAYHVARCQDWVAAGVHKGDSGAPVFKWWGDGTVTLYGVLWGAEGDTYPYSSFIFSSMVNVRQDLGSMTTFF